LQAAQEGQQGKTSTATLRTVAHSPGATRDGGGREEFRKRLWPADVYVDFDRSLNKAIVKLRDALGDKLEFGHAK
jgi:hypothetical protein